MKRGLMQTAVMVMCLAVCLLSGCGREQNIIYDRPAAIDRPQVSLTFFGYKYEALNVMAIEDALHGYMDGCPEINISYDGIKSPEYFEILEKRIATGNGDDIFMVDHERVLELSRQGKLADLSSLSTLDGFSELARSQMGAGGKIDYLPTSISAFGLYCNMDLLREHGQKVPQNLAEFEAVCDYFVSRGITPVVANNDISLKTVVIGRSLLHVYQSADTAQQLERLNADDDSLAESLRPGFALAARMLERGWVSAAEAAAVAKTKDDLVLFADGTRPFMLTGAWASARLRELEPDFRFEVHPYPIMEDGSVLVINVDTRVSVNAESPHVEEAKRFVEYLTQRDTMWEFVNSQSSFSPLRENQLAQDEAIQSIAPYLTNGRSVLGADDNLRLPIWDMTRQCVVGMLEGDGVQEAVTRMKALTAKWQSAGTGADT